MSTSETLPAFTELGLAAPLLKALNDVGYETPSMIQAKSIPPLLEGKDILGQAQTGTGKTAAFALPLLSRIDIKQKSPQVLVLAPTRELAIQVAEAFQSYAHYIKGFHVLPVYGGQSYEGQLRALKRGVHVVVGTPGRVMDHMRRGTLSMDNLQALVLDEADEMLRMGFIDDVEWVLEQTPPERQVALFSATMPNEIRKVARNHLNDPVEIRIKASTTTATTIRQRYWPVKGTHKLDALTRILEMESFDAMIIFVRTKIATEELAEKLEARGFACAALNGDIAQKSRERTIERLKKGQIDILVATDVAARGLDVERISHVVNFDIPYDTEAYVHRIGRTGRAGREGEAILFVAPREKRLLFAIEKATRQPIEMMTLPTTSEINAQRVNRFKQKITETLESAELAMFRELITEYLEESEVDALDAAAALATLAQGDVPLLLTEKDIKAEPLGRGKDKDREPRERRSRKESEVVSAKAKPHKDHDDIAMERFIIQVGYRHNAKPGNIVGAIANEADIESQYIGHIEIYDDFSTVDLPEGMPKELLSELKKTRVCGALLNITRMDKDITATRGDRAEGDFPRGGKPGGKGRGDRKRSERSGKPGGKFSGKPSGKGGDGKKGAKPAKKGRKKTDNAKRANTSNGRKPKNG